MAKTYFSKERSRQILNELRQQNNTPKLMSGEGADVDVEEADVEISPPISKLEAQQRYNKHKKSHVDKHNRWHSSVRKRPGGE